MVFDSRAVNEQDLMTRVIEASKDFAKGKCAVEFNLPSFNGLTYSSGRHYFRLQYKKKAGQYVLKERDAIYIQYRYSEHNEGIKAWAQQGEGEKQTGTEVFWTERTSMVDDVMSAILTEFVPDTVTNMSGKKISSHGGMQRYYNRM